MINQCNVRRTFSVAQCVVTFELLLISIIMGTMGGWTVSALPKLKDVTSPVLINDDQQSLIASVMDIGRSVGSVLAAVIISIVGSKTLLLIVGLTEAISLIILALSNSVILICSSRFISGLAIGMLYVCSPLFIGEISIPKYRGGLVGVGVVGSGVGQIIGSVLGAKLNLNNFAYPILGLTLVFLTTFYWLPKSPYYLIKKNLISEATKSLEYYRPDVQLKEEIESLQACINSKKNLSFFQVFHELFMIPYNTLGLIKIIILFLFVQMSGHYAVTYYSEEILESFKNKTFVVNAITAGGLIGSIIGMLTSDKFGRKILLGLSSCLIGLSLVTLGVNYILLNNKLIDNNTFQYIIIGSLLIRMIFLNYGIYTIPGTLLSEIFSENVKNLSVCIVNIISGLSASLAIKLYQPIHDAIDYNVYFLYAFIMFLLCIYTIIFLPETKGKSLIEIQEMLQKKQRNNSLP